MRALVTLVAGALSLAQFSLVELHRPSGAPIYINPDQVTSVRTPENGGHFARGTRCLIYLTNGNFITVREACAEASQILQHPVTPP
jgi:hypothetical protein